MRTKSNLKSEEETILNLKTLNNGLTVQNTGISEECNTPSLDQKNIQSKLFKYYYIIIILATITYVILTTYYILIFVWQIKTTKLYFLDVFSLCIAFFVSTFAIVGSYSLFMRQTKTYFLITEINSIFSILYNLSVIAFLIYGTISKLNRSDVIYDNSSTTPISKLSYDDLGYKT
ncbi:hypothetical protein COBT_003426 [Conglomerata obtusa]